MNSDILIKLRLAGQEFSQAYRAEFDKFEREAESRGSASGRSFGGGFAKAAATLIGTGTAGLIATFEAVRKSADFGEELKSTSQQLGISVERLQEYRFAAQEAGTGADALDKNVERLTRRIGEANEGNRTAQKGFVDLGVGFATVSGQARATDEVFLDVIQRLSEIEDPARRAQVGTQLLGERYAELEPLVRGGAAGIAAATDEARKMGVVLTSDGIADLDRINNDLDRMKTVLSVRIADVVADNSDAIFRLTDALFGLADQALKTLDNWMTLQRGLGDRDALIAAAGGLQSISPQQLDAINRRTGYRETTTGSSFFGLFKTKKVEIRGDARPGSGELDYYTDDAAQSLRDAFAPATARAPGAAAAPVLSPKTSRKGGGRSGKSEAERERERAAKEAERAEERLRESVERTLRAQQDSARVEAIRAQQGESAAAAEEARLSFIERNPGAIAKTADELAKMLGIEGALTAEKRAQLEAVIKQADIAEDAEAFNARRRVDDREEKRIAEAQKDFAEAMQQELQVSQDIARIEAIRAQYGETAAAAEGARLGFLRQHPLAVHRTVEELAAALGITRALTDEDRKRLQLLIDQRDAAEHAVVSDVLIAEAQARQEAAIRDVADLYETLFHDGVEGVWDSFKAQGLRVVAEIAAQWTLALISGQSTQSLGSLAGSAVQRSPLGGIFGGLFRGTAANDNVLVGTGAGPGGTFEPGGGGHWEVPTGGGPMGLPGGAQGAGANSLLQKAGIALSAAAISNAIVGGGTGGQIGSMIGAIGGQALGGTFAALGSFGGPIGALAGALLGSVVGGLFKKTPDGNLGITGLGSTTQSRSNDSGVAGNLSGLAGQLTDNLKKIADALGAEVGAFSVSIGQRNDYYRVGGSAGFDAGSKYARGALYNGTDPQRALEVALGDALSDGAIKGISAASQRILASGQDLEKAIEKAVLIESVPRLLRQRLDPLGAEIDSIDGKFRQLADALREGGASAEQIAEARQLWQLEREDAIRQIGEASKGLKDYLASLRAGPGSPLSLRQQQAQAEEALKPFVDQIAAADAARAELDRVRAGGGSAADVKAAEDAARLAAGKIDQSGFQDAAQLLLSLTRQIDASGGGFFAQFDRISALTGRAIGAIDGVTAQGGSADPFTSLIAQNTDAANGKLGNIAALIQDTNTLLRAALNDNGGGASGITFFGDSQYVRQA